MPCHFLLATIYSVPPLMLMSLNVQFAILLAQIEGICVCSWFLNQIYLLCEHVRKTTQKTWEITAGRILGFLFPQRFDCYDKLARSSQWRATSSYLLAYKHLISLQKCLFFTYNLLYHGKYRGWNGSTIKISCWATLTLLLAGIKKQAKKLLQPCHFHCIL